MHEVWSTACVYASCKHIIIVLILSNVCIFQALVGIKEKLSETEGPDMKEQMQDQIRQWFIETRLLPPVHQLT